MKTKPLSNTQFVGHIFALICFFMWAFLIGMWVESLFCKPEKLTYIERQRIAIDFMNSGNGTWRYTLCSMPMDSKRAEGENKNGY